MQEFKGEGAQEGLAIGKAVWYRNEPQTANSESANNGDPMAALGLAREKAQEELNGLADKARQEKAADMAQLFETHALLTEDPDLEDAYKAAAEDGLSPAEAIIKAGEDMAAILAAMDDEYMQARSQDVKDVCSRLSRAMQGKSGCETCFDGPSILLAQDLTPSEIMQLDKAFLMAIALQEGTQMGHTAILARTLGIPLVIGLGKALEAVQEGNTAILDGARGFLAVNPDAGTLKAAEEEIKKQKAAREAMLSLKNAIAKTSAGQAMQVYANISGKSDAEAALKEGCDGIGVYRSEFLYLEGTDYPSEERQFKAYKEVVEMLNPREVIIRTCDIGSDKQAAYFDLPKEANPALGFRALRIGLERKEMFKTQLRALYRASACGNLSIMFPMVASLWELKAAKEICQEVQEELKAQNLPFNGKTKIGIMIETPAAALISADLAKEADFFSCGTNDLTQYTLACDRQSSRAATYFNPAHPAVLALIEMAAKSAHAAGIPIGICGESAANPDLLDFYLKAGIDELSVSPAKILPLKSAISNK